MARICQVWQQLVMNASQGRNQGSLLADQQGCAGTPRPHQRMQRPGCVQHVQQAICKHGSALASGILLPHAAGKRNLIGILCSGLCST